MLDNDFVSVIVPMYNVGRFVGKCVRSVLGQTYAQIEVVAVNDCSPDDSLEVVRKIAAKDGRVRIVDLAENGGVSNARYVGLQQARGEFVMFVDGDDFLPKDAVETLLEEMRRVDADVVEGGCRRVFDRLGLAARTSCPAPLVVEHDELMEKYFISFFGVNILGVNVWGKLYKHELLTESDAMRPTHFRMGEDLIASMRLFPYIKRYSRISAAVYNYRWGGITSGYNPTLFDDLKEQYYIKLDTIERFHFERAVRTTKIEMCNVLHTHLVQLLRHGFGRDFAREFLTKEIESGYVREITEGIDYHPQHFSLLKERKVDELLDLSEKEAKAGRFVRWTAKMFFKIVG